MHTTQRRSAEVRVHEDNNEDDYNSLEDFASLCDDAVAGWDTDIVEEEN